MGGSLSNIFWLGTKELRSFFSDAVLLGLVIYAFSLAVYVQARSNAQEVYNASIRCRRSGQFVFVAANDVGFPAALFQKAGSCVL